jgi:hypothetical protein
MTASMPRGVSVTGNIPTRPSVLSPRVTETNALSARGVRDMAMWTARAAAHPRVSGPGGQSFERRPSSRVIAGGVNTDVARRPAIEASSHGTMI